MLLYDRKTITELEFEDWINEWPSAVLKKSSVSEINNQSDDHGDSADTATPLTIEAPVTGQISGEADSDWFTYEHDGSSKLILQVLLAAPLEFFTSFRILNSNGNPVNFRDDGILVRLTSDEQSGIKDGLLVDFGAAAAGTYFIEITSPSVQDYSLSFIEYEDDFGNNAESAAALELGASIQGSSETVFDSDWFEFTVEAGRTYLMVLESEVSLGSRATEVWDSTTGAHLTSEDNVFATNSINGSSSRHLYFSANENGKISLSVELGEVSDYTVSLTEYFDLAPDFTTEARLYPNGELNFSLFENAGDSDVYRFDLLRPQTLEFSFSGSYNYRIYRVNGEQVEVEHQGSVLVTDFDILAFDTPGTYYLEFDSDIDREFFGTTLHTVSISVTEPGTPTPVSLRNSLYSLPEDAALLEAMILENGVHASLSVFEDSTTREPISEIRFSNLRTGEVEQSITFAFDMPQRTPRITSIAEVSDGLIAIRNDTNVFGAKWTYVAKVTEDGAVGPWTQIEFTNEFLGDQYLVSNPDGTVTIIYNSFQFSSNENPRLSELRTVTISESGEVLTSQEFPEVGQLFILADVEVLSDGSIVTIAQVPSSDGGAAVGPQLVFLRPTSNGYQFERSFLFDDELDYEILDLSVSSSGLTLIGEFRPNGSSSFQSFVQRFDSSGEIDGPQLNFPPALDSQILNLSNGGFVIWGSGWSDGQTSNLQGAVALRYFDESGNQIGDPLILPRAPGNRENRFISEGSDGEIIVSYEEFGEVILDVYGPGNIFKQGADFVLTSADDVLSGTPFSDIIIGNDGNDKLAGLVGNDRIEGGSGFDDLSGGRGNDVILGGDQNDNLYGGDGNDQVLGQRGADFLYGGAGNDLLLGGNRNDRLFGEDGNDRVFGGNDQDTISGGNGRDIVRGGNGDDLLNGDEGNDVIFGGTGRDMVYGDDGDDFLSGRGGFDVLNGGAGNDTLEGGVQADQFVFEDGFGNDTITDFASLNNAERIHLTNVTEITDFQDLVDNHMVQDGADVVISDGLGNTITLLGVNLSDLGAADFVF